MANLPQNQEYIEPGNTIILDVFFRDFEGGPLVDADSDPTFTIYNPDGDVVQNGTGDRKSIGEYEASYFVPTNGVISDLWRIEWNATINGVSISALEYFRVVAPGSAGIGGQIIINITDFNLIKSSLGFPTVDSVILNDSAVKEYCIYPALREYFVKFPIKIKEVQELSASSEISIDFPDNKTFGIAEIRMTDKGIVGSSKMSFWELAKYNSYMGSGGSLGGVGKYGTKYMFSSYGRTEYEMAKQTRNTAANQSTFSFDIDRASRQLNVYTEISGKLNILWAKFSYDFDDVMFEYKNDVIKLAKAYLMQNLADTAGLLTDGDVVQDIDTDTLNDKAGKLFDDVKEKWEQIPDVVAIRI